MRPRRSLQLRHGRQATRATRNTRLREQVITNRQHLDAFLLFQVVPGTRAVPPRVARRNEAVDEVAVSSSFRSARKTLQPATDNPPRLAEILVIERFCDYQVKIGMT